MRKCSKCKVVKNLETAFHKNKNGKDGRQHYCKECMKELSLERNGGRKLDKLNHTDTHRQCRVCLSLIPKEDVQRADGYYNSYNYSCININFSQYNKKNTIINVDMLMMYFGINILFYIKIKK